MSAARDISKPYRVEDGSKFRLKDFDPAETLGLKSKEHAQKKLEHGIARLAELQEKLYAQDRWAFLLILQAMDAAGKDSTIKHVMSGVNPQGCQVNSYKTPSAEELEHDFLWRTSRSLPEWPNEFGRCPAPEQLCTSRCRYDHPAHDDSARDHPGRDRR